MGRKNTMEVPSGYDEYKQKRLVELEKRKKFEKDTEKKTEVYII